MQPAVSAEKADSWAGLVLLYHRIATQDRDPWSLCVQPKHFEAHLQQLTTLAVGLDRVIKKVPPRRFVLLTFDDGYRDNLECALPLMERYEVPGLVFVVTGPGSSFWWEHLARQSDDPGFLQHYQELKRSERPEVTPMPGVPHSRLTDGELRQLGASPLIELGAHTMSHSFLPALSPEVQQEEILGSRDRLVQIVGAPVRSFAYPFGAYEPQTSQIVAQSGFEVAFTSSRGLWRSRSQRLCLPRVIVRDLTGSDFSACLAKWL